MEQKKEMKMAVDELTCGQGGSNGEAIIARINELAKLDPKASMRLQDPTLLADQIFTDDLEPILMLAFDTIKTEQTGFVADLATQSLKNNSGHPFNSADVSIGLNVEFGSQENLEIYVYVNGVVSNANYPITITGAGNNKPVEATWESDADIAEGDIIDLRARNAASGNLTVKYLRTHFLITASWKETLQS